MKKSIYILVIFFALFPCVSKSQQINAGTVRFTTTTTDTVNNTTFNLPDTIHFKYYFKGNNFRIVYGTDSANNSFIVNSRGRYSLNVLYDNKKYSYDSLQFGIDSLINFWDTTTVRYMLTSEHKSIMGYYCTKGYFFFVSDAEQNRGDTTSMMAFWYTEQIQGNNFIPGANASALNLNGLILGYEIPVVNGIEVVTAISVSTEPIDDNVFFPDLTGYVNDGNNIGN